MPYKFTPEEESKLEDKLEELSKTSPEAAAIFRKAAAQMTPDEFRQFCLRVIEMAEK